MKKRNEEEKRIKQLEYIKKWQNTPYGRANHLLNSYRQSDRKANRGEGNLTTNWIVENIFSKPCAHCGKEGWKIIGCNRLDNSKPHTTDNVEPCCFECNRKYKKSTHKNVNQNSKFIFIPELYQYTLDGKLVAVHKNFIWSKTQL